MIATLDETECLLALVQGYIQKLITVDIVTPVLENVFIIESSA